MMTDDYLLSCVLFLAEAKGYDLFATNLSKEFRAPKLTGEELIEITKKYHLSTTILERPIGEISDFLLPVILLLKDNRVCVLVELHKNKENATVFFPEQEGEAQTVNLSDLEAEYYGQAITINDTLEPKIEQNNSQEPSSAWFWNVIFKYKSLFANVLLASLMINLFALAIPMFIMNVYDRVVPNRAYETLWVLASGIIIILLFDFLIKVLRSYFLDKCGRKIDLLLSSDLLEKTINTKMEAQSPSIGQRATQIKEFGFVREFFSSFTIVTLVDIPFAFLFLLFIYLIGGSIVFIPLFGMIFILTATIVLSWPLNYTIRNSTAGSAQKNAVLVEALSSIEDIKSTNSHAIFLRKWQELTSFTSNWLLRAKLISSFITTLVTWSSSIIVVSLVIYGVYLIGAQQLSMGGLIACTILTNRIIAPLNQLANLLIKFHQAYCSYKNLNAIMQAPVDYVASHRYTAIDTLDGSLGFNDVSFRYPGQTLPFFDHLSFKIKPGEKIALLGSMGSGKSTLLKLMDGLFSPISGEILIGGVDINQISIQELRLYLGYLAQDPKLFSGTLRDNLTLRSPYADEKSLLKALEITGIAALVQHHPKGMEMHIGERGLGLSGGQRQALALSRTLLDDPSILLLDEPTSSMDVAAEMRFVESMKTFFQDKTVVMATHKNPLLMLVDRILVLQQGKLIMDGPKEEVLAKIKQLAESVKGAA